MKVMIFYRDASDYGQTVREFLRDFYHQSGKKVEEINPDSPSGSQIAETYDIMEYPTLLAIDSNGQMLQQWSGIPLPRISEVSYYVE